MTEVSGDELRTAYEAIQADELARARDILSAYLVDHPNDPDGWWLYAHAVSDASQGLKALETVIKLDPKYPNAQALIDEATAFDIEPAPSEPAKPIRSFAADQPKPSSAKPATVQVRSSGSRIPTWLVAVVVLLIVVAALALLLPRLGGEGEQSATAVADASETPGSVGVGGTDTVTPQVVETDTNTPATGEPTETLETTADAPTEMPIESPTEGPTEASGETPTESAASPTEEPSSAETAVSQIALVESTLSGFAVVPGSEVQVQTPLGNTAVADVCTDAGSLRSQIPDVITALGTAGSQIPDGVGGLAVRFVDCNANNALIRYVGISSDDARAFAAGEIDEAALRSRIAVIP